MTDREALREIQKRYREVKESAAKAPRLNDTAREAFSAFAVQDQGILLAELDALRVEYEAAVRALRDAELLGICQVCGWPACETECSRCAVLATPRARAVPEEAT